MGLRTVSRAPDRIRDYAPRSHLAIRTHHLGGPGRSYFTLSAIIALELSKKPAAAQLVAEAHEMASILETVPLIAVPGTSMASAQRPFFAVTTKAF
jgi:hypothetical protein